MRPIQGRGRRRTPDGTSVVRFPTDRVGWQDALEEFCRVKRDEEGRSPKTLENYRWVLGADGRVCEFARDQGLGSVDQWDAAAVQRFMTHLGQVRDADGQPYSPHTLHIHYRNLKQFLRFCLQRGYLRDAAVLTVKGPRLPDQLPRSLTAEEERRLLAVARNRGAGRANQRDAVLVELMLRCGLRPMEVERLSVDDIVQTVDGDWLLRVHGKGEKERIVPVDTPRYAFSKELLHYRAHVRPQNTLRRELFLSERRIGEDRDYVPLSTEAVTKLFQRLGARAGLPLYAYRLRHTFAMRALAAGVKPNTLRRAMGHSSFKMTMRYLEARDNDLIEDWQRRKD